MSDMQNENQNNDSQEVSRVKSLPDLLSENNNLRKRLAEIEIQGVFASKTILRAAKDNIVANNKDFKIYLENIYKQRQANDKIKNSVNRYLNLILKYSLNDDA